MVFLCLQVTRYAAAHGIKYVALSSYEATIFGMFRAPHQLLLSKPVRFDDTSPSVLQVKTCCNKNAKPNSNISIRQSMSVSHCNSTSVCAMDNLSQWHVNMQCVHAFTAWASSEDLHQPWKPHKKHAPSEVAVEDAATSRRRPPKDGNDGASDHGACDSDQEAGSVDGQQGTKRKRGAAAESSIAGHGLPPSKKASLSCSSVFRISDNVPLVQQQWQEQKEGQHSVPDLAASAAAFCLTDICGVIGKGASGYVFAARCA